MILVSFPVQKNRRPGISRENDKKYTYQQQGYIVHCSLECIMVKAYQKASIIL